MVVLNKSSLKEHSIFVPIFQLITKPILALTHIHHQYGEMVLVSFFKTKLLFVCKPEYIEEIYNQEGKGLLSRDFMYDAKKLLFGDGLVNSKDDTWTKQRRLMQPLFTKEAIAVWGNIIINEADGLTDKLKLSKNPNINLSSELKILIQAIFIKVLFGKSADISKNSSQLIQALDCITRNLAPHLISETIGKGKLKLLFPLHAWRLRKAIDQLTTFVNQSLLKQFEEPSHSLISLLIQAKDKMTGYSMTKELLKNEAMNLFFAGQDTTTNTLSWFFYLISKHEAVHKKISEEIRVYKDDPLTFENLAKLSYTKAVLYETLRLYPPTTGLATQALEDVVIGGQNITKGTTIILSMYATHHHENYWKCPNEFYPEHFLNQAETERHKYAFFPFGGGVHNCIGRHFAELEMMIIIATLLRVFTFKTDAIIKEALSITLKPDHDVIASMNPIAP